MKGNKSTKRKASNKNKALLEFLGPVENLESYVKADWWRQIFNANYLRTDGDVVEDALITEKEVNLFLELTQPDIQSPILDLCCGQGRHAIELANRGYENVHGLDRSHYLINRAKNLAKKGGHKLWLKEGDARKLPYDNDQFRTIFILGNSFGYFDSLKDDLNVLKEVFRVLQPGGDLLIDITDGDYVRDNFQKRSWEWIDKQYFVCRERSLSEDQERLISREVITHAQKGVIADQFYAERLYNQETISELLSRAGFEGITFPETLATHSQRNQDLGMMERRILVMGKAIKQWSKESEFSPDTKEVIILLGDPTKKDKIKPNGVFDQDDLQTVQHLKNALGQLKNYHFTYLDNHTSLVKDLLARKTKTDFVFNLCDEGFQNEATQELHIPALLEVLGIPFTGSGPQNLAYCFDKSLVRGVAQEMDIPVSEAFLIKPEDTNFFELPIEFPVIVKPNYGDSSFGISQESVCNDVKALENAIVRVREKIGFDQAILVESFLTGNDLTVGIIGNPPNAYEVFPVIEEDYSALPDDLPKICGYEAKWDQASPYFKLLRSIPTNLDEDTERFLIASCIKLFERLKCQDYARFDWRIDQNGTPRLLEVNPNPGWCWDGHLAKMAELGGVTYKDMLNKILQAAENRLNALQDSPQSLEKTVITGDLR